MWDLSGQLVQSAQAQADLIHSHIIETVIGAQISGYEYIISATAVGGSSTDPNRLASSFWPAAQADTASSCSEQSQTPREDQTLRENETTWLDRDAALRATVHVVVLMLRTDEMSPSLCAQCSVPSGQCPVVSAQSSLQASGLAVCAPPAVLTEVHSLVAAAPWARPRERR